jgi:hypothetical protein
MFIGLVSSDILAGLLTGKPGAIKPVCGSSVVPLPEL